MNQSRKILEDLLRRADIRINGDRPWDIQVTDERVYDRILTGGSLAAGESYMDGAWDAKALDEFFARVLGAHLDQELKKDWKLLTRALGARLFNFQSPSRAFKIGTHHYDKGNDLYEAMLGKTLAYTCGYWTRSTSSGQAAADNLDAAQEAKLDLVCKKINLQPGQHVLDIGCGWGSFAKFAAEKYGAVVTGVTVSKEQVELARKRCAGLPVTIKLEDYRKTTGTFDHIISLGMFEHVGYKNYRTYMEVVERCLAKDGLFLLHTIGGNKSVKSTEAWLDKYIFPNSMLPSIAQISRAAEGLFVMEDWHNFGANYDKTLMAWFTNFDAAWDTLKQKYDNRFYRMWKYYLLSCAGAFRVRNIQLWQIVMSKNGVPGGYTPVR